MWWRSSAGLFLRHCACSIDLQEFFTFTSGLAFGGVSVEG